MSITRAQVETRLLARAKKRMAFVGMDSTTANGTNADLNDPLATALDWMGLPPVDGSLVTDADLTSVEDVNKLLDLAEYRLLQNIVGNVAVVDTQVGQRRQSLGQVATALEAALTRKERDVQRVYGLFVGSLTGGSLSLDFMQEGDDES